MGNRVSVWQVWLVLLLVLTTGLSGCGYYYEWYYGAYQRTVYTHEDVGDARTVVLSVAPWEDYVQRLQPQFQLKPEEALKMVLQQPNVRVEEKGSAGLSVQASIPAPTGGTPASGDPLADAKANGLTSPSGQLAVDPVMQHLAATALFQEVQLLNSYLRNADIAQQYRPYLVRLEIGLMPKARYMPYDAYTMLTFFQAPAQKFEDKTSLRSGAVKVLPLLVSDQLEMALAARSHQMLIKLAAQMSQLGNPAASADISTKLDKISASLAQEYNSLFTVSRVNDNTLRVRMGAQRLANRAYAMVPRTHHLNLLVLVPKADLVRPPYGQMELTARTQFLDADNGTVIEQGRDGRQFQEQVLGLALKYVPEAKKQCLEREVPVRKGNPITPLINLINFAQANDYPGFMDQALGLDVNPDYLHDFWLRMLTLCVGHPADQTTFYLPCRRTQGSLWLSEKDGYLEGRLDQEVLTPEPLCEIMEYPSGWTKKEARHYLLRAALELTTGDGTYFLPLLGVECESVGRSTVHKQPCLDKEVFGLQCGNIDEGYPVEFQSQYCPKETCRLVLKFDSLKTLGLKDIKGPISFSYVARAVHTLKYVGEANTALQAASAPEQNNSACGPESKQKQANSGDASSTNLGQKLPCPATIEYENRFSAFLAVPKEDKAAGQVKFGSHPEPISVKNTVCDFTLDVTLPEVKSGDPDQPALKTKCSDKGKAYSLEIKPGNIVTVTSNSTNATCPSTANTVEVLASDTLRIVQRNVTDEYSELTITPKFDGKPAGDALKIKLARSAKSK
ncbi:MAG: hypothetical protein V1806_11270 [Pseudomonadota bacterium]